MSEPDYKRFAMALINDMFKGVDVNNFDVQDMAVKHGILKKTKYDPERHGDNDFDAVKGDDWYEFVK
jgi:hypothetical protein